MKRHGNKGIDKKKNKGQKDKQRNAAEGQLSADFVARLGHKSLLCGSDCKLCAHMKSSLLL